MLEDTKDMLELDTISAWAEKGVDNLRLGRASALDYESIKLLGEYLQVLLDKRNDYEFLGGDPSKTLIMWRTFGKNTNDCGKVALQTWFFRKRLDEVDNLAHEQLTELYNTCMSLTRTALEEEAKYPHSTRFAA